MSNLIVAETILHQLGGPRFRAMTGARSVIGSEDSLSFRLPSNFAKSEINHVTITLEPSDTYRLVFSRIRGGIVSIRDAYSDIYADQLRDVFTRATGLDTSMGRMQRAS